MRKAASPHEGSSTLAYGVYNIESLTAYGFYKEFSIDLAYPTVSYCSLTIEGLT